MERYWQGIAAVWLALSGAAATAGGLWLAPAVGEIKSGRSVVITPDRPPDTCPYIVDGPC